MVLKNSHIGFIPEVDIPFNKIDSVVFCQAPVQVKMVLQMSKIRLDAVGGFRNIPVIQIVKHIG